MSAREALLAVTVARLRGSAGLAGASVFDAPPVRAALPYVQVEEPLLADWSTKSWAGREGRLTVLAFDGGERPVRLRAMMAAVEGAMLATPTDLGGGWRLATVTLARSRLTRGNADRWTAAAEFQVRLYQPN